MTECVHGFDEGRCAACAGNSRHTSASATTSSTGRTFALVYAPSLRFDTFLHLNRQGDQWKFRWYSAPDAPPVELAQSAPSSGRGPEFPPIEHEIAHPHSSAPEGVGVKDSRYWFEVIARMNRKYAERIPEIGRRTARDRGLVTAAGSVGRSR